MIGGRMKYIIATILILVVSIVGLNGQGADKRFTMSIKPGMYLNAAHFGITTGRIFAGFGLECLSVSVKSTYTSGSSSSTFKTGATVFLPQLASKVFLSDKLATGTGVQPYLWLSLFYSIATAKVTYGGQSDTESEKAIKDLLGGNFGGSIAFGGEYHFAPEFSIGGEFGLRLLFGGTKSGTTYTYEDNLGLGLTYTALGLNFYF